ncbi:MAG: 4-alpha-glucanotransferase [Firmicutes bacterium]|nr:4-alpha-glucanotransferase [Bacillota bacterium]
MMQERKCGILAHPTSFPSKYGIGDLGKSAYDFIDFLEKGGQKIWQVLPLCPTSFGDSPYQSFSAFAGNYFLISPDELKKDELLTDEDLADIPEFDETKTEYGKVIPFKIALLKKAFEKFDISNKKYKSFCKENKFWLDDYALYAAIKDHYIAKRKEEGESAEFKAFKKETEKVLAENVQNDYYYGAVWATWDKDLVERNSAALSRIAKLLKNETEFYKFVQFKFFEQWDKVKKYAEEKGIEIIGDIPIFIAFDSADAWANQHLFQLSKGYPTEVAGVPPDYFSKTGQLWGNPLYVWKEHEAEGFAWWINRMKATLKLCHIVRIDHFRGFEANYAIPFGAKDATVGKWKKGPGKKLFNAIKKELGSLPVIAEDLGIITDKVEKLRDDLGLPGMKILQFAFDDSPNNAYLPHNCVKNCVMYTGTHDNDTTLGWYNSTADFNKDYFRRYMNVSGENVSMDMIRLAVSSCADRAVYPLQDVLGLGAEARFNTPGEAKDNWQWRYTSDMLTDKIAEDLAYITKLFKR